ncbi:MAG: ABC transporter permease, partial [Bacteroidota bacterium]
GPALKQDYPEVEEYVRFVGAGRTLFKYEQKEIFEEEVYIVDSTVFDMFTFEWVYGNGNGSLDKPSTAVLAQSVATKFFGNTDPVGKRIKTEAGEEYEITGVYADMPKQSHIIANVMFSGTGFDFMRRTDGWGGFSIYTYVLLHNGVAGETFSAKLPEVVEKYVAVIFAQFDISVEYTLLPITDIHLKSDFQGEPQPTGNMSYIYIFAAIGLFMILIACINYMNLATARAASRAREIGIRKVMGSYRSHLIGQFLAESTLTALISFSLALILVFTLLPLVNTWLEVPLSAMALAQPKVLLSMFGIFLIVALVSGSYPAFFLSAMEPVKTLKGAVNRLGGHATLRKSLVVLQFAISLFMLVSTGIVFDQLNYLQKTDLGFTNDPVVRFGFPDEDAQGKWPVLEQKLEAIPQVMATSTSNASPGNGYGKLLWNVENNEGVMEQKGVDNFSVDWDYIPTLEIDIVAGRNFDRNIRTDSFAAIIVNEAFVKRMSWDEPIGKRFQYGTED